VTNALCVPARASAAAPLLWQSMLQFIVLQSLGTGVQLLSGTITSIYLGRLIGLTALAAASAFFPILFFLVSFLLGLISGGIVLVGQAEGARDRAQIKAIAGTALSISLLDGSKQVYPTTIKPVALTGEGNGFPITDVLNDAQSSRAARSR
jgi:hypothetical protein